METTVNVHGDPADCKCECHTPYDPNGEGDVVFISHWGDPCCGPARRGSRVETLPGGRDLTEEFEASGIPELQSPRPTVYRKDCRCACHRETDIRHIVACCFDPEFCATDVERDVHYFNHRMVVGLGIDCESVNPDADKKPTS